MHPKKFFASIVAAALLGGGVALGGYQFIALQQAPPQVACEPTEVQQAVQLATLPDASRQTAGVSFVSAAQVATPTVVHIKAKYEAKSTQAPRPSTPFDQLLKEFFGEGFNTTPREYKSQPQQTAGSGVIIAKDGYIVTNNHVVDGADKLEVTLADNRQYTAQLVGQDPDTDLALLKIKEQGLPYLQFGNSDTLQVGEWVLAVGNPFNLTSTVTKGIVSAKARTIGMSSDKNKMPIEAFIQTDAAVNRGNSGGALVNLRGELVGINTAILGSSAGTFAGYSFAIPGSIVEKVTGDLKQYGKVQRGMLGVIIRDMNAELAKEKGLKRLRGVYVEDIVKKAAAAAAGLQPGDVIVAIDGQEVKNTAQLQEQIARHKPDDKVRVTFYRKAKKKTVTVMLKGVEPKVQIVCKKDAVEIGGAIFEHVAPATKKQSKATGGVRLKVLKEGPWKKAGIKQGFIITAIDKEPVKHLDQFATILKRKADGILVEGFYQKDTKVYYGVDLGGL